jgi:hypothetical protein
VTAVIEEASVPRARQCVTCGRGVYTEGLQVCSHCIPSELGITFKQFDHWSRKGYLRPERRPQRSGRYHNGTGVPRRWPPAELEIARRMGRLTAAGLTPERAAVFARESWPSGEIAPGIRIEVTDARS